MGGVLDGRREAFVRGLTPGMLTLESVIGDIARTNIPVLVVGESGSGKQMFAPEDSSFVFALRPGNGEGDLRLNEIGRVFGGPRQPSQSGRGKCSLR